jgi:hypothetical protein
VTFKNSLIKSINQIAEYRLTADRLLIRIEEDNNINEIVSMEGYQDEQHT